MRVLVVSKSLCGYVSNQVQYNMESAQYLNCSMNVAINFMKLQVAEQYFPWIIYIYIYIYIFIYYHYIYIYIYMCVCVCIYIYVCVCVCVCVCVVFLYLQVRGQMDIYC